MQLRRWLFAATRPEKLSTINLVKSIGLPTKLAGNRDLALLTEYLLNLLFAQHAQHISDPLACAGAMPAHGLGWQLQQILLPEQAPYQIITIKRQQLVRT